MNSKLKFFILIGLLLPLIEVEARNPINGPGGNGNTGNGTSLAAGCAKATAYANLELNNVRALIAASGQMWMDPAMNARYEVPKNSGKHSMFAGSLWLGGQDEGGQLKLAVAFYSETDYWTGPLIKNTAEIDAATCAKYDKFFVVDRPMVEEFNARFEDPEYTIPSAILNWPAHGDPGIGQDFYLAPFFDRNGDGTYNPTDGDYPHYDLSNSVNCKTDRTERLYGDSTIWWVFNDKGNVHTSGGQPIGMEIHGQAFAFATSDEINNMTFYNYRLFNRSTQTLKETYFGIWCDPDLGYYEDDFVGCDVKRGLAYCYNGTAVDGTGGPGHYNGVPPAVGIDYFEGPYQDNDGIDNGEGIGPNEALNGIGYGDGIVDNERFGMRRFVWHNKTGPDPITDPEIASDYYNYLRGIWKDGTPMTYGGNGYGGTLLTHFMFPGNSDQTLFWGTNGNPVPVWSEESEGNVPADRRMLQSAGPFVLYPGAVNDITFGVVWAQATAGGPMESVEKLRITDDKAQALFDNCFRVLEGPHAPNVNIVELDRELILTLSNDPKLSNNRGERYEEFDPTIPSNYPEDKKRYKFEGYQIFQLRDNTVSPEELYNPDKARLLAQTDLKNGIGQIVNYNLSDALKTEVPQEMVAGQDKGILHSFRITEDLFAAGDRRLVNHKTYYYMAIAYGYNNFKTYIPGNIDFLDGQRKPYMAGRKSPTGAIKTYSGVPHINLPQNRGIIINSEYGEGPHITRIEGQGNGGQILDFTPETENQIMAGAPWQMAKPVYQKGRGPVNVKVIDPLNIPSADFELWFKIRTDSVTNKKDTVWHLVNLAQDSTVYSDTSISMPNEQLIPEWGLSVSITNVLNPGGRETDNGYLEATIVFADADKRWLEGVADAEGPSYLNWIRSGTLVDTTFPLFNDYVGKDNDQVYEKMGVNFFAPHSLTSYIEHGPLLSAITKDESKMDSLKSVDIVITNDKSKWTRCPVIENQISTALSIGKAKKNYLRESPSIDKEGNPEATGTGMGWFPGYAICLETGERLNMAYSEDSWLGADNGADMLWNPTSNLLTPLGEFEQSPSPTEIRAGGKHFIYVFNNERGNTGNATLMPNYDEGSFMHGVLSKKPSEISTEMRRVWRSAMWVGFPLLNVDNKIDYKSANVVESDVRIRLRVARKYGTYNATGENRNNGLPLYNFNTTDMAADTMNATAAKMALALINVVPNPYYAFSQYEKNQLENRIKITNLPQNCEISIYTLNGTLIKRISKGDPSTSADWDLKNQASVPIASGIYLIHVNVPGVGERTLKWFGILRPTDLDSF